MDFTINMYCRLLTSLQQQGFSFQTFESFLQNPAKKAVVLRHDVDKLPKNSLAFARIQHSMGIAGTYYFRAVPVSWDEAVIREIASLGHEIGYHYETMDAENVKYKTLIPIAIGNKCKSNELVDRAYISFCENLEKLRRLAPVSTICMHGSPRSKFDNREIWKKYDYRQLGIAGEPYFDVDYNQVAYLTDTGRRWNGLSVSVRDKVESPFYFNFRSTSDIIRNIGLLPDRVLFTFHPQRWTDDPVMWMMEYVSQLVKNKVKAVIVRKG